MPVDGSIFRNADGSLLKDADGSVRRDCCCPNGCDAVMPAIPCRSEFDEECNEIREDKWVCADAVCAGKGGEPISLTEPTVFYDSTLEYCFVTVPDQITNIGKAPEGITPLTSIECTAGNSCLETPCLESGEGYPEACQCLCYSRLPEDESGDELIPCCFGLKENGTGNPNGSWDFTYTREITIHLTRIPMYPNPFSGICPDIECITGVEDCLVYHQQTRSIDPRGGCITCGPNTNCCVSHDLEGRTFVQKTEGIFLCCSADNAGTNEWSSAGVMEMCVPFHYNETSTTTTEYGDFDGCEGKLIENYSNVGDCDQHVIIDEEILYGYSTANVLIGDELVGVCVCQEIQTLRDVRTWTYFNPATEQGTVGLCGQCQEEVNREDI